ncbi:MAG: L-seryl-tRNA(Sec) selenium transferase [Oscillospiraceae bacterium]|nr:L-seryl-tRNA(Sec) selenium transferase [Oscillospiraceae bacterium]
MDNIYDVLPKVLKVLRHPEIDAYHATKAEKAEAIRDELAHMRTMLVGRESAQEGEVLEEVCKGVLSRLQKSRKPYYRRVINATGIVLHTNMGRAVLPELAKEFVRSAIEGYSNLELEIETGRRGKRYGRILERICTITGAEAAIVVNNNAAATLLALHTLCPYKEAIISKGELVAVGDGFRVPNLMVCCGTVLREVGTTNQTLIVDYEQAICDQTGVLQKVYTSNYVIKGFHASVSISELVALGKKHGLPVISDLGSGCLSTKLDGVKATPAGEIAAGADVVTFSGDKLLGGPQCGVIIGKAEYIAAIKKNPLMRAMRLDKMTLAALDGTLIEYIDEERAMSNVPVLSMISASQEQLMEKAESLLLKIKQTGVDNAHIENIISSVGGGSMPGTDLDSFAVCFNKEGVYVEDIAAGLRRNEPPIISFIRNDQVALDPRTMTDAEIDETAFAVASVMQQYLPTN